MSLKSPMKILSDVHRSATLEKREMANHVPLLRRVGARAGASRHALRILRTRRGPVAGLATGDTDMDLMALADRQRRGGDGRFERRFLGVVVVLCRPVMEDGPAVRPGNDHVIGQSHRSLLAVQE